MGSSPSISATRARGFPGQRLRALAGRAVELDVRDLRVAGTLMAAASILLPLLPGYAGTPCPLRALTGVPCPLCGMTTSVRSTMGLDLERAWASNPGGIAAVLAVGALLVIRPARVHIPQVVIPLVLGCLWVFELVRFSVL